MSNINVGIMIKAYDKASKVFTKVNRSFAIIEKATSKVRSRMNALGRETGALGAKFGLLAAGASWAFNNQFLSVASNFEKYKTILETLEGSNAKAEKSMQWVEKFARKTPYELDNVFESFVQLRAYGLEPTNGLLKTLGDTSASMNKPILQAVEAIAGAVTGENERLKAFGIKAQTVGDNIAYQYAHNGKTIIRQVDKSNRAMIQSTLEAIFNQKYTGAMSKLSRTWGGMFSNLSDYWTKFKKMVMDAGAFDWLKEKLEKTIGKLEKMTESGKLKEYADATGKKILSIIDSLHTAFKQIAPVSIKLLSIIDKLIQGIGGYGNALTILMLIMAGKVLISVIGLGKAYLDLGKNIVKSTIALRNSYIIQNMLNAIAYRGGFLKALNYWLLITKYRLLSTVTATKAYTATMWLNSTAILKKSALMIGLQRLYRILKLESIIRIGLLKAEAVAMWASTRAILANSAGMLKMGAVSMWSALVGGLSSATAGMWAFTVSLLANPITWIVAGVAALAGAGYLVYKNWQPISDFFSKLWTSMKNGLSDVLSKMQKLASFTPLGILAKAGTVFAKSSGTMPSFDIGSRYISQTGIATVHEGEEIAPAGTVKSILGQNSNGNISVSYSPNISISGADKQAKEDFRQMLNNHKNAIVKIVANAQRKNLRTAF